MQGQVARMLCRDMLSAVPHRHLQHLRLCNMLLKRCLLCFKTLCALPQLLQLLLALQKAKPQPCYQISYTAASAVALSQFA